MILALFRSESAIIVSISFLLSRLTLVLLSLVLLGLVRSVVGRAVASMDMLFMSLSGIGLGGFFLIVQKLVISLCDWLEDYPILSPHHSIVFPKHQFLTRQLLQLLIRKHVFLELFLDLPNDQMLGELWMKQVALRVLLEILINTDHSILEVPEQQLTEQFQLVQGLCGEIEGGRVQRVQFEDLNGLFLLLN